MKCALTLALATCLLVGAAGCSDSASTVVPENTKLIQQAKDAVYPALVRIHVVTTQAGEGRMRKLQAAGSGAIISPDGYVITNHHVAGRAERLVCRLADRQEIDAVLVGTDPMCDIAVLKLKLDQLKDKSKPLPVAYFGDSDKVQVGETAMAMGSPAGLSQSVTVGVISNTEMILPWGGMEMEGEPVGMLVRWIGHDAVIYHGNSGGPLVNLKGQIIGINEIGVATMGGAIPSNLAKCVALQLIESKGHRVARSWTGLESQPMLKSDKGATGVLVASVVKDSPADKAGLQSGDVVTEFDGKAVKVTVAEELPLFNQLVLGQPVGKAVKVVYRRGKDTKTTQLTTAARERAIGRDEEIKSWGMTAMDLTLFSSLELQRSGKDGVLVESVRPSGPCSEARPAIVPGDVIVEVNGQKVKDLDELRKLSREITKDSTQRVETLIGYERGVKKLLTVVRIGKEAEKNEPSQARKAWLGVSTQVLTKDLAKALNLTDKPGGVRITQVLPGTNAQEAKLQVGDIILAVDGEDVTAKQVEDEEVFPTMIRKRKIDNDADLAIVRDGKPIKVTVKLQAPPTPANELKVYKNDEFEFTARDLAFLDKTDKKLDVKTQGVLIDRVEGAGWAALAGMAIGDVLLSVDGQGVADIEALKKMLDEAKAKKPQRMVFVVKRGIHTLFLELAPAWE